MSLFPVGDVRARHDTRQRAISACQIEGATTVQHRASRSPTPSRIWRWVLVAFAIQCAAWTAWFVIAAHNKIEEVPLATDAGAPRR